LNITVIGQAVQCLKRVSRYKVMKHCPKRRDYTLVTMYFLKQKIKHISRPNLIEDGHLEWCINA
jgi:hypothetical protein